MQIIPPKEISIHEPNILCERFHEISNRMKRFCYPYDKKDIPGNGIYVVFEGARWPMAGHGLSVLNLVAEQSPALPSTYKENKDRVSFARTWACTTTEKKGSFSGPMGHRPDAAKNRERYAGRLILRSRPDRVEVTAS